MGPKSNMTGVLMRNAETHRKQLPDDGDRGWDDGFQAKESQGLPATTQSWKREERMFPYQIQRDHDSADSLISDF